MELRIEHTMDYCVRSDVVKNARLAYWEIWEAFVHPWGGDDMNPSPFFYPPSLLIDIAQYIEAALRSFVRRKSCMRKSPHIETTLRLGHTGR